MADKPIYHQPYRLAFACEHLGRVLDRLDCNCPHQWVRQCDVHEKTSIDFCLTCSSYSPDDPNKAEAEGMATPDEEKPPAADIPH